MKEVRELTQQIAKVARQTGHPEWIDTAQRIESFAAAFHNVGKLPGSLDEHIIFDFETKAPEGVPAEMEPPILFPIRYKREYPSGLQGQLTPTDRDLTRYTWRWDDQHKRVERTGLEGEPKNRYYLAETVLERKLGRPLKPDEFVRHLDGERTDLQRTNLEPVDPQTLYRTAKKRQSKTGLLGVSEVVEKQGIKYSAQVWDTTLIGKNGKPGRLVHLGMYDTSIQAGVAVDERLVNIRGANKTRLNFPDMWK